MQNITGLEKNPRQNITEFCLGHPSPTSLHTILLIERSMLQIVTDGALSKQENV